MDGGEKNCYLSHFISLFNSLMLVALSWYLLFLVFFGLSIFYYPSVLIEWGFCFLITAPYWSVSGFYLTACWLLFELINLLWVNTFTKKQLILNTSFRSCIFDCNVPSFYASLYRTDHKDLEMHIIKKGIFIKKINLFKCTLYNI